MKKQKYKIFTAVVLLLAVCCFPFSVKSQVRPVYDYGANGLGQLLKKLNTTKSVLMIGAHPDDEDSALLAYLARGENARTAYLSLNRGDGGQNIIGSELFESLGVIRTEELLQARRLDGAEQFFTRTFDYGFSKTLAEAKEKWDEKIILCDAVRVIRTFRPLVVISRFSGTPADGHGQHQYSGYISPLAVKAAADPAQCKDSGVSFQVQKFYVEQGFRADSKADLRINTGQYDYLLGRSYAEIAAEGRSQHRTQEQGNLELKGDRFSGLNLIESQVPKVENETSIFDGIDTTISGGLKKLDVKDTSTQNLNLLQNLLKKIKDNRESNNSNEFLRSLLEAYKLANSAKTTAEIQSLPIYSGSAERRGYNVSDPRYVEVDQLFEEKEKQIAEIVRLVSGLQIDALSSQETVSPNEDFLASVKVFYPKNSNVKIKQIKIVAAQDWEIADAAEPKNDSPFAVFSRETANDAKFFKVKVPAKAQLTEPYFLEKPRIGSLYQWNKDENQNLPFQKPLVSAQVTAEINGTEIIFNQPIEYRYADAIRGEVRRELNVVPKISVAVDQNLLVIPQSEKEQRRKVILSLTNNSSSPVSGAAKLILPKGWTLAPDGGKFDLKKKDEKTSIEFVVTIPAKTGAEIVDLDARAETADGEIFTKTLNLIQYSHIQTHRFYTNAKVSAEVFDLKTAPVKVGYIMGSGDDVPDAVRQMNLPVDLLTEKDLSSGDLSKYDTIVVGIRAYQVRGDLIANNQRIFDYVKNGGNLIVQYQRPDYVANNFQPFPASMTDTQKTTAGSTARVVDENAKVTILQPDSPVFNSPNKITDADFAGWVQERDLYNFVTFDEKYTGLLELHDAGEQENKGGMVYAKIGKGNYVYTSYSFFRQLPAGVPGAYRLFANLLNLK